MSAGEQRVGRAKAGGRRRGYQRTSPLSSPGGSASSMPEAVVSRDEFEPPVANPASRAWGVGASAKALLFRAPSRSIVGSPWEAAEPPGEACGPVGGETVSSQAGGASS